MAKLTDTRTGDTLAPKGKPVAVPRDRAAAARSLAIAIKARTQADEDKLGRRPRTASWTRTRRCALERNDETHQTLL